MRMKMMMVLLIVMIMAMMIMMLALMLAVMTPLKSLPYEHDEEVQVAEQADQEEDESDREHFIINIGKLLRTSNNEHVAIYVIYI